MAKMLYQSLWLRMVFSEGLCHLLLFLVQLHKNSVRKEEVMDFNLLMKG